MTDLVFPGTAELATLAEEELAARLAPVLIDRISGVHTLTIGPLADPVAVQALVTSAGPCRDAHRVSLSSVVVQVGQRFGERQRLGVPAGLQ